MTQPPSSGTTRLHPLSRSFSLATGVEAVEYTEHRGHDAPPASLGAPGDIYLDLKTPALYSRAADGWTKWPGPGGGRVAHPAHPDHVLWASIRRSRVLWLSKHKMTKLIGSAAEILKKIIESEGRRDSKVLKRKADGDDTAGMGDAKKPRASGPPLAGTELPPVSSALLPAPLAPSTPPLPPPLATKSVEALSKQNLLAAPPASPAQLPPVAPRTPPAIPPVEKPALLPTPSKQTPFSPALAAAASLPKSLAKPTPSTSGPPAPNKLPVQLPPPPSPKAAIPRPATSPSLKRLAPKTSDNDGPRAKRQRVEPPSPAAIETAMQPVQRELAQLEEGRASSDTKKRFLMILGRHITQVLDDKEHDREQWQIVLWECVARSWPKKAEWTRLEKEFKKMVKADSSGSRASSDVSTPAANQSKAPPSLSSPAPATSTAMQRKTGWDSGAASASASAPVAKPAGVLVASVPSPVGTSAFVPAIRTASGPLPAVSIPVPTPTLAPAAKAAPKYAAVSQSRTALPPLIAKPTPLVPDAGPVSALPAPTAEPAAKPTVVPESRTASAVPPVVKPAPVPDAGPSSARSVPPTPNPVRALRPTFATETAAAKSAVVPESRTAAPPPVAMPALVPDATIASGLLPPPAKLTRVRDSGTLAPAPAAQPAPKPTVVSGSQTALPRPEPGALVSDAGLASAPSVAKPTSPVARPITKPTVESHTASPDRPRPTSAPLTLAEKPTRIQDSGAASAPTPATNTELDELLTVLRSNAKILKAAYPQMAQVSSPASSPVIPHPTRIAALRRQYTKYRSEADSERQTSHQWRAETAASAALIDVLTMANDALTGENDAVREENVRLRDLIKRLDPNGGEVSHLPEPVEPRSESCIFPPPQSQGRERDCSVGVPSSQSPLPMEGMEELRVSQDGQQKEKGRVELKQQGQVELGSEEAVEGDVSMEGTEDLRFSPDRQEEEEEEGHVGVGQQEQVETRPEGQVEEDANDLDNIELGQTEEQTKQREGEQQAAVEEAKKTSRPGSIRIKREVTHIPVWVPANADDPEIIDLTLDDSDDNSTGVSVPSPSPAVPSAPNPTVAGKNAGSLGGARAPRDAKGAHDGDGDDVPMGNSLITHSFLHLTVAEVDALVKPTAPGHFCITGVDFDYTDKCLGDVVLQNGAKTDNTIPTWGKVLAHLQLIGQASSSARYDIRWTETIEALKDYYVQYLTSSPPPSNSHRQPKPSLGERIAVGNVDETSNAQDPSTLSQALEIDVVPCQAAPILPDLTQCNDPLRLPQVKVEASNFDGNLAAMPACVRRLNQTHLDEIFPTDGDEPLCCAWCEGSEVQYEYPADTPLEELSAHVEKQHPDPFQFVLAETAGMNPEEIVEWFTRWDGD